MSHPPLNDREVERVLAGQQPYGHPEVAEVAYFIARLRALVDFAATPAMSPELRSQLAEAEAARPLGRLGGGPRVSVATSDAPDEHDDLQLVRLDDRREERRARSARMRLRWRLAGAAAAVATIGGVVAVGLHGGEPERQVQTETVVDPAGPPTTAGGSDSSEVPAPPGDTRTADLPTDPPAPDVETRTPSTTAAEPPAQGNWSDPWSAECDRFDLECFCDMVSGGQGRQYCAPYGPPDTAP